MGVALAELTHGMTYACVRPDSPLDFRRLPALPRGGYRIRGGASAGPETASSRA